MGIKGFVEGGIASIVAGCSTHPLDLIKVRMQLQGEALPSSTSTSLPRPHHVTSALAAFEGQARAGASLPASLYRGPIAIQRAMVVTASQLATYDQAKESIRRRRLLPDGLPTHVAASCTAGLVASIASNPIDVIKTRFMNMKAGTYSGVVDCALTTIRAEGPLALYKGFLPTVMRQGPFTIVLFVTLEEIRYLSQRFAS